MLVQTFRTEKQERINEAETRLRFIDPFFEALGWDIRNPKEVRIESTLCRSDSTRPDYRFIIDSKTKFFVEAKKPSVKLTDPAPVFQAKSYGFSSKVPLVILTDFEEFRPFRTLARPKFERPTEGLIKEFDYTYDRYVDEFDNLYDTFSRDAVASGELEKRIPHDKKEASKTVDKEFLADLSRWQEELAKNIALRNSRLSVSEINEAVQRILDRIIFLRICEDRQIEESEILLSYADKESIYPKLLKEFVRLRSKYNGLIFNEHRLSEQLSIDDKLLKEIIKNLYLPHSPYRFNEIPIEILGTIYEQYLGKVITLTPSHRAKVEVKPEVRKAGGVFYTPQFITSYIVKNTIGKLIEGKTPEQIAKLRFADIACGSGSFLLEMFDYLIRYHIDYYSANPTKIKTVDGVPDAFQTLDGLWHLSTRKKKEILLNNIYGVDIDPQAVEVTQMSLYLKLLEGENAETFGRQLSFELKETILPNLARNIKCGNSLVGMDILDMNKDLFGGTIDLLKIRPFDWETAFPEVMKNGGFDAIVGNPPWIQSKYMNKIDKSYFEQNYKSAKKQFDVFNCFIEKAFELLNKNGVFGYIVPSRFIMNPDYEPLRKFLVENVVIDEITDIGEKIFEGVEMPSLLLFYNKNQIKADSKIRIQINVRDLTSSKWAEYFILQKRFSQETNYLFTIYEREELHELLRRIEQKSIKFGEIVNNARGVEIGKKSELVSDKPKRSYVKFLVGEDIGRYYTSNQHYLMLGDKNTDYKDVSLYEGEKIVIRKTGKGINATLDCDNYYVIQVIYIFKRKREDYEHRYLLGLLNSKLMSKYYFAKFGEENKQAFPHLRQTAVLELPIRTIDFNNPEDKAMHDRMVQLVERMLDLHKKKQQAKADSEKELFAHQIKATDKEIDELVYRLYGLTEKEISLLKKEKN